MDHTVALFSLHQRARDGTLRWSTFQPQPVVNGPQPMTLEAWGRHYNTRRPHQALDWKTPAEVRAEKLASPPLREVT